MGQGMCAMNSPAFSAAHTTEVYALRPPPPVLRSHGRVGCGWHGRQSSKKGKIPVIDDAGKLVSLATRAMLKQMLSMPDPGAPSLDAQGRLLCGAACGTREADKARIAALVEAGLDAVILDSSQGDSIYQCVPSPSPQLTCRLFNTQQDQNKKLGEDQIKAPDKRRESPSEGTATNSPDYPLLTREKSPGHP